MIKNVPRQTGRVICDLYSLDAWDSYSHWRDWAKAQFPTAGPTSRRENPGNEAAAGLSPLQKLEIK